MARRTILCGLMAAALMGAAGAARAVDEGKLKTLEAPPPAAAPHLTGDQRSVKLTRMVVDVKSEPWAFMRDGTTLAADRFLTLQEGQKAMNPARFTQIFAEELQAAGGKAPGAPTGSLFATDPSAGQPDLLAAVKITALEGRFCKACNLIGLGDRWAGSVVMTAHWEVYSVLDRRVVAAADLSGGYNTPSKGVEGDPERLVDEAFRDNVRRLIATQFFREAVSTPAAAPSIAAAAPKGPLTLTAAHAKPGVGQASASVAMIYASAGSGSGFLVSDEGYLLTNHHVVGADHLVKVKWDDGSETVGEVLRSDAARDVALVRADPGKRPALAMRHTPAQQGETVFAIGSPLGDRFQNTMSKGIVSALRNQQGLAYIQSDVMVNHGSSGGPLIDEAGRVIGLTASGQVMNGAPVGINFFIPIDDALKTLSLTAPPDTAQAAARP